MVGLHLEGTPMVDLAHSGRGRPSQVCKAPVVQVSERKSEQVVHVSDSLSSLHLRSQGLLFSPGTLFREECSPLPLPP